MRRIVLLVVLAIWSLGNPGAAFVDVPAHTGDSPHRQHAPNIMIPDEWIAPSLLNAVRAESGRARVITMAVMTRVGTVPEPAVLALLGIAMAYLGFSLRKKKSPASQQPFASASTAEILQFRRPLRVVA